MASIVLGVATNEPDQVRQAVAERAGAASGLPAYRALLDRQGFGGVHETVLAGDEDDVAAGIRAYADAAASDVLVSIVGEGTTSLVRCRCSRKLAMPELSGWPGRCRGNNRWAVFAGAASNQRRPSSAGAGGFVGTERA